MLIHKRADARYKNTVCANGLQVCFIYCNKANKAALSISINSGNYDDPDECAGLAHLFEHLILASSHQSSSASLLNTLISKYSGYVNAYTGAKQTNFHFNCDIQVLEKASKQLVDMLIHPSFEENLIEREIEIINSEFFSKQKDDNRRLLDVVRETCNPKHPMSRFSVGNKDSYNKVGIKEIRSLLDDYHRASIRADNMKAVFMIPNNRIDDDEGNLEKRFIEILENLPSKVEGKRYCVPTQSALPPLYLDSHLNRCIKVIPHKSANNALFTFILPNLDELELYKPLLVLSHLLEDPRPFGLKRNLLDLGWIHNIHVSGGQSDTHYQEFNVNIALSDSGLRHLPQISFALFSYIDWLNTQNIEPWLFIEKREQLNIQIHNQDPIDSTDEVIKISSRFHDDSFDEALNKDKALVTNSKTQVALKTVLTNLTESNLRLFLINKHQICKKTSAFYSAPYEITSLPAQQPISNLTFKIPTPNRYMPTRDFETYDDCKNKALTRVAYNKSSLWSSSNKESNSTFSDLFIAFKIPSMYGDIVSNTIKKIWISIISNALEMEFGYAEFAGLNHRVYGNKTGFSLHLSGVADQQVKLATDITQFISGVHIGESQFETGKIALKTKLTNTKRNNPLNRLFVELNAHLDKENYTPSDVINALDDINSERFLEHIKKFNELSSVEMLYVGQNNKEKVLNLFNTLVKRANDSNFINKTINTQKPLYHLHRAYDDSESACILYFQAEKACYFEHAMIIMIERLLSPLLFEGLRNKRKLGYIVGSGYMPINKKAGIVIYCQSTEYDADFLKKEIYQELDAIIENTRLSVERVDDLIRSLTFQMTPHHSAQGQYAQYLWSNLDDINPDTDMSRLIEYFKKLSLENINEALIQIKNRERFNIFQLTNN